MLLNFPTSQNTKSKFGRESNRFCQTHIVLNFISKCCSFIHRIQKQNVFRASAVISKQIHTFFKSKSFNLAYWHNIMTPKNDYLRAFFSYIEIKKSFLVFFFIFLFFSKILSYFNIVHKNNLKKKLKKRRGKKNATHSWDVFNNIASFYRKQQVNGDVHL